MLTQYGAPGCVISWPFFTLANGTLIEMLNDLLDPSHTFCSF